MWKRRLVLALAALVLTAGAAAARSILVQPGPRPDPDAEVVWLAVCAVNDATHQRTCNIDADGEWRLYGQDETGWLRFGIEIAGEETVIRVTAGRTVAGFDRELRFTTAWFTVGHEGGARTDDCEAMGCSMTGDDASALATDMLWGARVADDGMFREDVLHIAIATEGGGELRANLSLEVFAAQFEAAREWAGQSGPAEPAARQAAAVATCQRDTTMEIVACLDGELAVAVQRLEAVYDDLLAEFTRQVEESAALSGVDPETRIRTLVDAQAAWTAFVGANCRVRYERAMGGSIAPIEHRICMIDATRARTAELEGFWSY